MISHSAETMGREPAIGDLVDQTFSDVVSQDQILMQNGSSQKRGFKAAVEARVELSPFLGCFEGAHHRLDQLLHEAPLGGNEGFIACGVPCERAEDGPDVAGDEAHAEIRQDRVQVLHKTTDTGLCMVRDSQRIDRGEQEAVLVGPVPVHRGAGHIRLLGHAGDGDVLSSLLQEHLDGRVQNHPMHAASARVHALFRCSRLACHPIPLDRLHNTS